MLDAIPRNCGMASSIDVTLPKLSAWYLAGDGSSSGTLVCCHTPTFTAPSPPPQNILKMCLVQPLHFYPLMAS